MEGCQGMMCPDTWTATTGARQKVLLIDRGQDVGHAALHHTVTDAGHPEGASLLLSRLGDIRPTHGRGPISLGVYGVERCGTPGYELLLEVVYRLPITPGCRVRRDVTEILPQPWGIQVMRQTGETECGFLPCFCCYPFESR